MGRYLSVGIAYKIFIDKDKLQAEDLSRQFDKNFKLELYDIEEDEDTILLT